MSVLGAGEAFMMASGEEGPFKISRSLRFNSADQSHLSRTPSSVGNRTTWTWSAWIKRAKLGTTQRFFGGATSNNDVGWTSLYFNGEKLVIGGYSTAFRTSYKVFRDTGAWFHLVVKYELGASAEADKIKAWHNGEEITWETSNTAPTQGGVNSTNNHTIGAEQSPNNGALNSYCDLYLAEVNFVDGQALAPTDFGEYDDNNVWQAKKFTGDYGTHVAPTYDSSYGSDITSTEVAKTIDGDLSTYGVPTGDFVGYTYSASNEPFINIKWENTKSSSITVYIQPWVGGSAANSGTFDSSGGNSVTIAAGATLNTRFNFPSGYQGYFRVYTSGDGAYLRMYDTGGTRVFNSFHLDFSDNSSNAALGTDSSGLSNTWTVNNLSVGDSKAGVTFDGTDDYLSFTSGLSDLQFDGDFCIEAFFKKSGNGDSGYDGLVALGGDGSANDGWFLEASTSRGIQFRVDGSEILSKNNSTTTTALTDGNWHHVAVTRDGSTTRLFLDGSQLTSTTTAFTVPTTATKASIGVYSLDNAPIYEFKGTISNLRIVKGSAVYTAGFTVPSTPLSNITNTKLLCCQSSSSVTAATVTPGTLSANSSPVAGTVTAGGADIDSLIDTPTNIEASSGNNPGNYATFNPLDAWASMSFANGNLEMSDTANGGDKGGFLTLGPTSGKFYWEITFTTLTSDGYVGLAKKGRTQSSSDIYSGAVDAYVYYKANGNKIGQNNGGGGESYGATWAANDVMGVAVDWDAGSIIFYKNGTSQGTAWTGENLSEYMPAVYFNTNGSGTAVLNAGQRPFSISSVPTGYKSLCTANLPDPTVADGSTAFNAVTYTGDGNSPRDISGYSFGPDLVWYKQRDSARDHQLYDTVRKAGTNKSLATNTSYAETANDDELYGYLSAFNSDGFEVTTGSSNDNYNNNNTSTYVAWAWDAGNLASTSSSAYNQTRTWSDNAVGGRPDEPIEDLFDGNTSTFAQNTSGNTNPNNIVVTFSPGLAYTASVEVYPQNASSCAVNNGSQTATTNNQWNTVASGSGTLTELDFQRNHTNGCSVAAIRVDNKILINPGNVPVGSLNSSVYDQSQTWSGLWSGTAGYGSFTNLHNANINTDYMQSLSATMTLSSAITITSLRIKLNRYGANVTLSVNGTDVTSQLPAGGSGLQWVTITGFTSLSSIAVTGNDYSSNVIGLYAIEVNGALLIDSGVSVTSVPTIASTVRANPSAGFSIVGYSATGSTGTVGHGLAAVPDFILAKARGNSGSWMTYHSAYPGGTHGFNFQATTSVYTDSGYWNGVSPDSNVITLGSYTSSANDWIAYCWSAVEGYSSFGKFTGNGSTDGTFVYTGHRSRFILIKRSDGNGPWVIVDTERNTYNVMDNHLLANDGAAENGSTIGNICDSVSNGFKLRGSDGWFNGSGATYVYAAFAEHPFKTARAR